MRGHPARDSVARCLHRFSIDKRSQLIDVGGGEMSLIGPRPAPPLRARPLRAGSFATSTSGSGNHRLWQAAARTIILFDEMVQLNVQYLQTWSFAGALRLLATILPALLPKEGV